MKDVTIKNIGELWYLPTERFLKRIHDRWEATLNKSIPFEPNWPEEYVLAARVDLRSCSTRPVQHLVSLGQERHTWENQSHVEIVRMPDRSFSAGDVLVVRGFAILYDNDGYTPLDLSA